MKKQKQQPPALDVPRLAHRINEIAKTYDPSVKTEEPTNPLFKELSSMIRNIVVYHNNSNKDYWGQAGIRTVTQEEFNDCLKKLEKNTKELGAGYYGKVLNVPADSCIKHIPKGVKHVGIKIENIKDSYEPSQSPENLRLVTMIGKKAGNLGIGPKMYDSFVSIGRSQVQIIKVFEVIEGTSWKKTEWKSKEEREKAVKKLDKLIHTMNQAGIIHHDLHQGNVMVGNDGKIYIIDFDLAKLYGDEEASALGQFMNNNGYNNFWNPPGAASSDGIAYIYNQLVQEGSIIKSHSKSTSNKKSSKKTRKSKNLSGQQSRRIR